MLWKRTHPLTSISSSLLIILTLNPYSILDIGMILSYGGAIGISLLGKNFSTSKHKVIEMIKTTLLANSIILPIMAYYFNTLSLTFILSNLLAEMLLGTITLYGFGVSFLSFISIKLAKIIAIPLNFLVTIFIKIAEICSKLPFSQIIISTPNVLEILFYYVILVVILFLKKKKISLKKCIGILMVGILLTQSIKIIPQDFSLYFIDVGQGDSSFIVTASGKTILIDGGGSEKESKFDVGESILLPFLLKKKIKTIDYLLISHLDADHVGGLFSIMEKLKVKHIILGLQGKESENYEKLKQIVKKKDIKTTHVKKGDKIIVEKGVEIEILWPKVEQIQANILNNNSVVAKITYKNREMLFTGDIEEIAEKEMIEEYKNTEKLASTILKVRTSWL